MAGEGTERDRCRRAHEWASLRMDGELSELERLLLRRHLGRCPSCRAFADGLRSTADLLRSSPVEHPSRTFALDVRPARVRRPRYRLAFAAGLVAVAAAVGGVVGGIVGGGGGVSPAPTQQPDIALRPDSGTIPTPQPPNRLPGENV
jgi:predicted anti-sigma-YlaC factor YlaD